MTALTFSDFEIIYTDTSPFKTLTFSFEKGDLPNFIALTDALPDETVPEYQLTLDSDLYVRFSDAVTLVFEGAGQSIDGEAFMLLGVTDDPKNDHDEIVVTLLTQPAQSLTFAP